MRGALREKGVAQFTNRYSLASREKAGGVTYTPRPLADFVAKNLVALLKNVPDDRPLRVFDPAVGDGELLVSLLERLQGLHGMHGVEVYGFDIEPHVLSVAARRLRENFGALQINLKPASFLDFVIGNFEAAERLRSGADLPTAYDVIIANPPYVRTQIMGTRKARLLAKLFGLTGRVDLYHAFILGMTRVLSPQGIAGIIVSNRFMFTRSGASVRRAIQEKLTLHHVWDLGDTKLFEAAVLPAVMLAGGRSSQQADAANFTSIYQTREPAVITANDPIDSLSHSGIVKIKDGRHFIVQHGKLNTGSTSDGVWRVATNAADDWLSRVEKRTWGTFRDVGKIRVGVKTCADKVFIRSDWEELPEAEQPELLRPLITHHEARRFRAFEDHRARKILYPHKVKDGRRCVIDLSQFPRSKAYLERHRDSLISRKYVTEAGREWYEIWVPQDPASWDKPKLVFRDISDEPVFWIDKTGAIVNGDCYWMISNSPGQGDLLWLAAAVGNSSFIKRFYDYRFHNKLYAGRRRFITQYVEKFPLPDPETPLSMAIIGKAKKVYRTLPSGQTEQLLDELNRMVWEAFGLAPEEVIR